MRFDPISCDLTIEIPVTFLLFALACGPKQTSSAQNAPMSAQLASGAPVVSPAKSLDTKPRTSVAKAQCTDAVLLEGDWSILKTQQADNTIFCGQSDRSPAKTLTWSYNGTQICIANPHGQCVVPSTILNGAEFTLVSNEVRISTKREMPTRLDKLGCTDAHLPEACIKVGDSFPFFALRGLDNKIFSLKAWLDAKAAQSYLINYFGTWCAPCVKELPMIQQLILSDPNSLGVLLAKEEPQTSKTQVRAFAKKHQIDLPIVFKNTLPKTHGVIDKSGMGVFPLTVLLDGSGTLRFVFEGKGDTEVMAFLLRDKLDEIQSSSP